MVRVALEKAGGAEYLLEQARTQPVAFMALCARLIPSEIRADLKADGLLTVQLRSYTGLAWENEAQRLAAEARVGAIEAELEGQENPPTVVLEERAASAPALPASSAVIAIESELPEPEPCPEPKESKITIVRPWEQRQRQRSALGSDY